MEEDKEESSKEKLGQDNPPATAASQFTDDLILEILSRLPARSVCRFKCVSMHWRDLIADPVHRKKLAQTLAGFFHSTCTPPRTWSHHFASVSSIATPVDPSLPFLQPRYKYIAYVDTCNGLLLCLCRENPAATEEEVYVVCNPATERWIELPPKPQAWENRFECAYCLAFDPKVSSHFHVLEFGENYLDEGSYVAGVDIFSSQTGAWTRRDSGLAEKITLFGGRSVFIGGMLHLVGELLNHINIYNKPALLVVDMEGKAWKTILLPVGSSSYDTIGLSQGCLHYVSTTQAHINSSNTKNAVLATKKITLWCLENYDSKEWVLKHSASIDEQRLGIAGIGWRVLAIHPDCDTIFMHFSDIGDNMLATYDMQHQKFVRILNLEKNSSGNCRPYVPLFSDELADADGQ